MSETVRYHDRRSNKIVSIARFSGDDVALVASLRASHSGAMEALFDRYANHVQRVLARVVGIDPVLPELLSEVFIEAYTNLHSIKEPERLKAWLTSVAVFTARGWIRRRSRRLSLWHSDSSTVPEVAVSGGDFESREALKAAYVLLNKMPADDRIAFTLRFIDEMELTEVAAACRVSLATIKRRLSRAQKKFRAAANQCPAIREWMEGNGGWRTS